MTNQNLKNETPEDRNRCAGNVILCIVGALVCGIVVWFADPSTSLGLSPPAQDSYYNLLVQGFRAGQLNLNKPVPAGLANLSDPYDPIQNAPYILDLVDLSYFKGKFYLYFGITPAVVFFWPYTAVTGHYASNKTAVAVFYAFGCFIAFILVDAIWRRYLTGLRIWPVALGMLMLGVALALTFWCRTNDIARICGFAFMMLALAAIWQALHAPKRRVLWLSLASLAYGMAVGSRPTFLFGVVILLAPVVLAWRQASGSGSHRKVLLLIAAAVGPVMLVGLGLAFYNDLRFGSPFEFGWHYQLLDYRPTTAQQFGGHYLWFNVRYYFLEPIRWSSHFPFLQKVSLSSLPSGYYSRVSDSGGGVLVNYPLIFLALAVPFLWRGRPMQDTIALRYFIGAVFLVFLACAITLCFFFAAGESYEMDFLPPLLLLAVIGIPGLEQALAHLPLQRRIMRMGVFLLLVYSVVFNLFTNVESHAEANYLAANSFLSAGHLDEAIARYQKALTLWPDSADANAGLGNVFLQKRQIDLAIVQYQKALETKPRMAETCNNLGDCFLQKGQVDDAIIQYQKALDITPAYPAACANLGFCLLRKGRVDDAIVQYHEAVDLQPNFPEAYNNLGNAYRVKRDGPRAVAAYQKAIEQQPQFILPQTHLAWMLATWPDASVRDGNEAVTLAEKANGLSRGTDPQILRALAAAYAEAGRFAEAISTAEKALALATAQSNAALAKELQAEIGLYQNHSPCRSNN